MNVVVVLLFLFVMFVLLAIIETVFVSITAKKRKKKIFEELERRYEHWKSQSICFEDWTYGYIICLKSLGLITHSELCDLLLKYHIFHL